MIRKDPKGGFKVVSESGKNLGGGLSKAGAHKRLGQVEYFKHKKEGGEKKGKEYGKGYLKSYGKGK